MSYTKTIYVDGSAPALDAASLNNAENGIEAGNLRMGARWVGKINFAAATPKTEFILFDGSGTSRSYWDGGSDAIFARGTLDGMIMPSDKVIVDVTLNALYAAASNGGHIEIVHLRGETETVIGQAKVTGNCYALSCSAQYPIEEDDYIKARITGLTVSNSSCEATLSCFVL